MATLQELHEQVYADAQRTFSQLETLAAKPEKTTEEAAEMNRLTEEAGKQDARLSELGTLIDKQKKLASQALSGGTARTPAPIPGQQEEEGRRRNSTDKERGLEAIKVFCGTGHFDAREFATITTLLQNGIVVPASVLSPLTPGLVNVFERALAEFGLKPLEVPSTEVIKVPMPDMLAGSVVTENATNGADATDSFGGSFTLAPVPVASPQRWFSYAALNAPGYDLLTLMLPRMQKDQAAGEEATDLAAMKADANIAAGVTSAAGGATITYAQALAFIEAMPAYWQADGQFSVVSASAYAAVLNLTSDVNNKLITVDSNNVLRIKGAAVYKGTTGTLDPMGLSKTVGLTVSAGGIVVRNGTQYRVNRYTDRTRRDQVGVEVIRDHVTGYTPGAVYKWVTPSS